MRSACTTNSTASCTCVCQTRCQAWSTLPLLHSSTQHPFQGMCQKDNCRIATLAGMTHQCSHTPPCPSLHHCNSAQQAMLLEPPFDGSCCRWSSKVSPEHGTPHKLYHKQQTPTLSSPPCAIPVDNSTASGGEERHLRDALRDGPPRPGGPEQRERRGCERLHEVHQGPVHRRLRVHGAPTAAGAVTGWKGAEPCVLSPVVAYLCVQELSEGVAAEHIRQEWS